MHPPLTAEEIAELRRLEGKATEAPWQEEEGEAALCSPDHRVVFAADMDDADRQFIAAARNALPRLLDEVERSRGTDHPERELPNMGATAIDTLNLAPFTPGGRFLYPRAYNQIHAELKRSRALLKRIEWNGEWSRDLVYRCPLCGGYKPGAYLVEQVGHAAGCELAALLPP